MRWSSRCGPSRKSIYLSIYLAPFFLFVILECKNIICLRSFFLFRWRERVSEREKREREKEREGKRERKRERENNDIKQTKNTILRY